MPAASAKRRKCEATNDAECLPNFSPSLTKTMFRATSVNIWAKLAFICKNRMSEK